MNLLRAGLKFPKIYGSAITIELTERLLKYRNVNVANLLEMQKVEPYETIKISDNFEVTAIPVSHSVAGAFGFYTKTKYYDEEIGILNMGDYNTEECALGEGFELQKFSNFMKKKPLSCVLMDSTSILSGNSVAPVTHKEAIDNIVEVCNDFKDKSIVTPIITRSCQNLYNFLEAARLAQRKVFLDSVMLRHVYMILQNQKLVNDYSDVVFSSADVMKAKGSDFLKQVPESQRLIAFSGAFGEGENIMDPDDKSSEKGVSGFVRFVNGTHRDFGKDMLPNCVVIAAQRAIPVDNIPVRQKSMYAKAAQAGAIVMQTETDEKHSLGNYPMKRFQRTGHATAQEMMKVLEVCNKSHKDGEKLTVIPVHGNKNQLNATKKILQDRGMMSYFPLNGDIVQVKHKALGGCVYCNQSDRREVKLIGFSEVYENGEIKGYEMSEWIERFSKDKNFFHKYGFIGIIKVSDRKDKEVRFSVSRDGRSSIKKITNYYGKKYRQQQIRKQRQRQKY